MLEEKLLFDYNVLAHTEFELNKDFNCVLCAQTDDIVKESAPFLYSNAPSTQLVEFMKEKFHVIVNEEDIDEHRKHIRPLYDEEVQARAREHQAFIESDLKKQVSAEDVIESTINALHARRLMLEKEKNYGKEWVLVCQTLNKWVELKLKKDKKIDSEPGLTVNFGELFTPPTQAGENAADNTAERISE